MYNTNSIQRPYSPTLSDGSKPKRTSPTANMEEEINKNVQKVRKLSPPVSPGGSQIAQTPSPSYVSVNANTKTSPKGEKQPKRSISPKALYPPSIQKYLNGKSPQSIDETIDKLKTPSNKTFKNHLEKMKLLGRVQEQEVESNIIFRKAYTNSTTSVSPARSGSPADSPRMILSPQHPSNSNYQSEDIVMTFDGDTTTMQASPAPSGLDSSLNKPNMFNQNRSNNMLGQQNPNQNQNYNGFPHLMGQPQGYGNNQNQNYANQRGGQFGQQNFGGYQGTQFNQAQQAYFNQYSGHQSNQGPQRGQEPAEEEEETRDRTTSFLQGAGFPSDLSNLAMLNQNNRSSKDGMSNFASNQLNAIQSMMQNNNKKPVNNPVEQSPGLIQYLQQRNSMPPPGYNQNYNMQQPQYNGGQQGQYMFQGQANMGGNYNQQNEYNRQVNPEELERKLEEASSDNNAYVGGKPVFGQGAEMARRHSEGKGQYSNMGISNQYHSQGHSYNEINHDWSMQNNFDLGERGNDGHNIQVEPDLFFKVDRGESGDFDMNIIPSDLNFGPRRQSDQMEDQLVVPDPTGLDLFLNDPHNNYKFNS